MDFELSEDQLALQQAVRDVAERECPPALIRKVVDGSDDASALWSTFVGLDWPSLTVPEADGGMGYTAVELAIVLDELGRVADPSPFLATTSQYAPLVREAFAGAGAGATRAELLGAVCAGGTGTVAWAFLDADIDAEEGEDGWTVTGGAYHVVDADRADRLAVVARTGPAADPRPGAVDELGVFILDAGTFIAHREVCLDGSFHVAEVVLDGATVPASRAATGPAATAAVRRAFQEALVGMSAATVGASQRIFELALGHLGDRRQFGVPIGSFQALKHMAVDVYIAIERARALCQFAGLVIAEDDPRRAVAASMAKAAAGDAQRIAIQHGIQFFGGLGYTWENDLQLYVRRAKVGELLLGGGARHQAAVAQATLATMTSEVAR